ncbi:MAG: hypothetical protein IPJ40_24280 [Saprospirales bacterium]|nr:hypothetical protein [Saprospirales bacterium]
MNDNQKIIAPALEKMEALTSLLGNWYEKGNGIQGQLDVTDAEKKVQERFPVLLIASLSQTRLAEVFAAKANHEKLLVIAGKISSGIRKKLRAFHVNYLDTAGNMYLRTGKLFLLAEGQKDYPFFAKEKRQLFTKTGIRLIFHLLHTPEAEGRPYRELAEELDISLGSVGQLMKQLYKEGFLLKQGKKGWRLHQRKALLERWIPAYTDQLKPGLLLGRYRFAREEKWQELPLPPGIQWGGEPAAYLMTKYLRPEAWTVYTDQGAASFLKALRLVPDKQGDVWVFQRFWPNSPEAEEPPQTVPALLVYGDLIASGDARNYETAQKIWDAQLKDQF